MTVALMGLFQVLNHKIVIYNKNMDTRNVIASFPFDQIVPNKREIFETLMYIK